MLAFIEGTMERQFVNANFKYIRVVPVQNGITWSPQQLCRQIQTAYRAFDLPGDVIVWLDREGRGMPAAALRADLIACLQAVGAQQGQIHVLVNDRMSENVILADEAVIRVEFGDPTFTYTHEGTSGKAVIKNLYRDRGAAYKETRHGVELLKKIRLSRCGIKSAAVQAFLSTFTQPCWWI